MHQVFIDHLSFIFRNAKDFNSLRCQEKQMLKLADLIKAALNEVGCEELPSGCDDISVDQSFIENNISNIEQPVSARKNFFFLYIKIFSN